MYRPVASPAAARPDQAAPAAGQPAAKQLRGQSAADPDAIIAPAASAASMTGPAAARAPGDADALSPAFPGPAEAGYQGVPSAGYAATAQAGTLQATPAQLGMAAASSTADAAWPDGADGGPAGPGAPATADAGRSWIPGLPGRNAARPAGRPPINRRQLAVLTAITVVVLAIGGYFALGHKPAAPASASSHHSVKGTTKPPVRMLSAGHIGLRASVPWSLVGAGWTLAEFSTAAPQSGGQPAGSGDSTAFLVDPKGGRYVIHQWPAGPAPTLIAWSGDGRHALFGDTSGYSLLSLLTGQLTTLAVPPGVTVTGFTRPDGTAVLAVALAGNRYKLQRYMLSGAHQGLVATMPRRPAQQAWPEGCTSACAAISSPDGDLDVWAVNGGGMEVVSNAGGGAVRLHAPGSGHPAACTPISWWNSSTVLASCDASGGGGTTALWLMPDRGGRPSPLTTASGGPSGDLVVGDAWRAGGQVYVTSATSNQCSGAASGPGGLSIGRNGPSAAVAVSGSTGNRNAIVASLGGRLLVLAQTSCPGSQSLLWLNPSSGATQPLLTSTSAEAGVIAAVPYGSGTDTAGN
jgi:TolB protein